MTRLVASLFLVLLCATAQAQTSVPAPSTSPAPAPTPAPAVAPAPAPIVRTTLNPADGIVLGQPVRLDVEVLFPGEMPRPPQVKVGDAPGAQVMRFESQATTIRDTIAGQNYVGQSFEFMVFPRRSGTIDVPPAQVTLLDRAGDAVGSAQGQPMRFTASVPPGLDPSGPVLAASQVTVTQSWSPDPATASFRAGGAITRTIQRRADGVPALGMAEFRFVAPDGVRVYADPPGVDDKITRAGIDGVRTDKVTYVFERPGTYALPALSQPWWNIDAKQAKSATLPGVTVNVGAARATREGGLAPLRENRWALLALAGFAVLVAIALTRGADMLRQRQKRYRASAAFARKMLVNSARGGDAAATWRAFGAWMERLPPDARDAVATDPRIRPLRERLDRALFGGNGGWTSDDGNRLAASIEGISAAGVDTQARRANPLPPLNPSSIRNHLS